MVREIRYVCRQSLAKGLGYPRSQGYYQYSDIPERSLEGDEAPTLTPPWIKNSNIDSSKTVIHLCAEVPHDIPIMAKVETYLDITQ